MNEKRDQPDESKRVYSGRTHKQLVQDAIQAENLEKWAADQVKPWRELRTDDYDFRSWANGASRRQLEIGCLYEHARESRRLRCLLAEMNPKRPREEWELVAPGSIGGREQEPSGEAERLDCQFEGLTEFEAERALPGLLHCFAELADHLVANVSFGELFRTKRDELERAFGGLDKLSPESRRFRHFVPADPVRIATPSEATHATTAKTISDEKKRIARADIEAENNECDTRGSVTATVENYRKMIEATLRREVPRELAQAATAIEAATTQPADMLPTTRVPHAQPAEPDVLEKRTILGGLSSEVIAIRISWLFTDSEIALGIKELVRTLRPQACKARKGKGRDREDSLLAVLDNLSAMRLIRWRPIGDAILLFEKSRLNARGGKPEQRKVRDQKEEAERDFLRQFPFGEDAANHGTFALH